MSAEYCNDYGKQGLLCVSDLGIFPRLNISFRAGRKILFYIGKKEKPVRKTKTLKHYKEEAI
jgi:hypothetical protein